MVTDRIALFDPIFPSRCCAAAFAFSKILIENNNELRAPGDDRCTHRGMEMVDINFILTFLDQKR